MANEAVLGLQWLYQTLSGDSTLQGLAPGGVWRAMAPPGTATPFVIISYQSGIDITTMNEFRLMTEILYQAKAVGPASQTTAIANAAAQIDTLIGGPTSGNVTGGAILACWRQSALQIDELVAGVQWTNIGGLYRLQIQQTS